MEFLDLGNSNEEFGFWRTVLNWGWEGGKCGNLNQKSLFSAIDLKENMQSCGL